MALDSASSSFKMVDPYDPVAPSRTIDGERFVPFMEGAPRLRSTYTQPFFVHYPAAERLERAITNAEVG